ncbi:hypothetical protein THARTR1_03204 [Trichoderma harzianum]|uniref:Kinesin motor domain-containing protein n=1 Tax=Trichoderma harzianum TaxID=5544 RepID=A0A2K0UFG7_TRIHA|nr:hypothetical protein THARTR1_03204 [Trichoderma harzianum]
MSVRVVARLRPLLSQELDKDIIVRTDSVEPEKPATIVKIPNPRNESEEFSFTFNGVYGSETTQETLFTSEGGCYFFFFSATLRTSRVLLD